MRAAFGLKAHSGWAALVALGDRDGGLVVTDRRRIELSEDNSGSQPLFREALVRATNACGLRLEAIPEKGLAKHAESAIGMTSTGLATQMAALGKSVGPPWGKDQKDAALAALVGLRGQSTQGRGAR
jgi:hypothetical protein